MQRRPALATITGCIASRPGAGELASPAAGRGPAAPGPAASQAGRSQPGATAAATNNAWPAIAGEQVQMAFHDEVTPLAITGTSAAPATGDAPRVLVAAASVFLRKALVALVAEHCELDLVAVLGQAAGLASAMARHRPEILLADQCIAAALPGLDHTLRARRVLVVSHRSHAGIRPGYDPAGICGFFGLHAEEAAIHAALRRMAGCRTTVSRADGSCRRCPLKASLQPSPLPLSPREREVFALIGQCQGNREIAAGLGCSVKTVEVHRENIKHKLGLRSGLELTASALAWCRGEHLARGPTP